MSDCTSAAMACASSRPFTTSASIGDWVRNTVTRSAIGISGRLAAPGETPAAFGRRRIPAGGVAPPSNTPGILGRRALPSGRFAALGGTLVFHHGLLGGRGRSHGNPGSHRLLHLHQD